MATKKDHFVLKDQPFDNYYTDNSSNKYSTINLNQSNKSLTLIPVHSQNKPYNDKHCGLTDKYIKDEKSDSSVQAHKSPNLATFNTDAEVKEANKGLKKGGSIDNTKNSILSLHISAYENSFESAALVEGKSVKKEIYGSIKEKEGLDQICMTLTHVVQNPFEFPRQQNDKVFEPEVSQYKASQKFITPDQNSNDIILPKSCIFLLIIFSRVF
uniref:Uncharacterized protein n=1 Tax=Panagrolaimus sp. PS1159 TaxID=55785 RepID=A0AC35GVP9_9BILA